MYVYEKCLDFAPLHSILRMCALWIMTSLSAKRSSRDDVTVIGVKHQASNWTGEERERNLFLFIGKVMGKGTTYPILFGTPSSSSSSSSSSRKPNVYPFLSLSHTHSHSPPYFSLLSVFFYKGGERKPFLLWVAITESPIPHSTTTSWRRGSQ